MQCPWPPCRMLRCVTVPLFTALKPRSLLEPPNKSSERILREREMRFAPDPVHVRSSGRSSHLPARGHSYSWPLRSAGLGPCMSPCGGGERAIDCYEASSRGPPSRLRTPPLSSAADRRAGSSSFSSEALAATQFRRVGRAAAVSRAAVSRRMRRWLLGGERRLGAAPRGVGSDGHASASVHWVGHCTRASGLRSPQTTWNRPELGETAASRGAVCFAIIV